ncbi:DUF6011 domain-containing protein [Streptomyces sanyensis]|uniref:DUF6011 domain-containing protein n=1 Tax=Streptomyces sanyensis TaxID=568869 RepID=UPI003D77275B
MTRVVCEVCGRPLTASVSAARRVGPVCDRRTRTPAPVVEGARAPLDHTGLADAGQLTLTHDQEEVPDAGH